MPPSIEEFVRRRVHNPNYNPTDDDYATEAVRLLSYKDWPITALAYPTTLSKAGFYYSGTGDRVRCFSCGLTIDSWSKGDDPGVVHRTRRPQCDVARERHPGALPWEPSPQVSTQLDEKIQRLRSIRSRPVQQTGAIWRYRYGRYHLFIM